MRILETVADMLADGLDESRWRRPPSGRSSVRTAYRYFPTKEDLIDAFNEWMSRQWGSPMLPMSLDEVPDMAAKLLQSFERNEKLVRAARRSGAGVEIRKRRKAEQMRAIMRALGKYAPHYDEATRRKVMSLFLNLLNSEAWLSNLDNFGMTTPESIEAVQWGIEAIIAKIDLERARKGKGR